MTHLPSGHRSIPRRGHGTSAVPPVPADEGTSPLAAAGDRCEHERPVGSHRPARGGAMRFATGTVAGIEHPDLAAAVGEVLGRRPAVGLALGVVRGDRLEFFSTHGVADIATRTPVTEDTGVRV